MLLRSLFLFSFIHCHNNHYPTIHSSHCSIWTLFSVSTFLYYMEGKWWWYLAWYSWFQIRDTFVFTWCQDTDSDHCSYSWCQDKKLRSLLVQLAPMYTLRPLFILVVPGYKIRSCWLHWVLTYKLSGGAGEGSYSYPFCSYPVFLES